jgi:CelD/BcsL family acetyltransferase involved in cellulose biosynthesis
VIELRKMPLTVGTQENPFPALGAALHPSGAHLVHLSKDWESFYRATRSSATRRSNRSKLQRMAAKYGEIRFVTAQEAQDAARTLETLMAQKAVAFARMGVPNLFARPGYREFFLDLARNPPAYPRIHISRLEAGSCWAAFNLGLLHRGTYYHVLASYDQGEVARYGPGAAHLRELMRYAIDHGLSRFDFTVGDEPYKFEWSDTAIRLYDHIAAATVRGAPAALWLNGARTLKRAIKQDPRLFALVGRVRAMLRAGIPCRRRRP